MTKAAPFLGAFALFALIASGSSQTLSQAAIERMKDHSSVATAKAASGTAATTLRMAPKALRSSSNFLKDSKTPQGSSTKGNPGGLPGIDSVPNFSRAFASRGQVWPFTMIGNDPKLGNRTRLPAKILAVSLELQNDDLVTTTKVPIAPFEERTLNSPNFEAADYATGDGLQYADAVQRAEFFHSMQQDWHTELHPVGIVDHITLQIPRFTTE
ncbi:MAG TPA: hypothetical protein VGN44_03390, partial [Candidatus Angelobacter sp.]